ncbi:MAG TPA: dTDP-4-dehydrorhamnose 3,5-epimerase [Candidatus Marinimicrobia bacterium]|jgi:dTDP-4-dehydrorhamnose 3,5-epimerase|nr:dTDP-4-dehydrorhamnose 3,5-epimerase [Candidatus Neomarinimicrobiota bacterium]|tara:strand:- start:906 stop:1451 length:546 start_codon:yes stop_codon:yes gene_type:complete
MIVKNTLLDGVKIITPTVFEDERGYFFESYKAPIFKNNDLPINFVQDNEVKSTKGVLRGLHYQFNRPQGKLVRVISGSILDVAVDIRKGSPTFGQSEIVHLTAENNKMLYIPEGFAHGYLVTSSESIVVYKCTDIYDPNDQYGIIWNDETIGVDWMYDSPILSEKDLMLPALNDQQFLPEY